MAEIEPSPGFAPGVMERVGELEDIRGLAREQDRQAWRLPLACIAGAVVLAWLVTAPLLPTAGALLHTAYNLLDEAGAASTALTPLPVLIGLLLGVAISLVCSARAAKDNAPDPAAG